MDLQRDAVPLRDVDVRLERAELGAAARFAGAVEVEPGLADRRRLPCQFGDVAGLATPALGLMGMETGGPGDPPGEAGGEPGRRPRGGGVHPGHDHPGDVGGTVQQLSGRALVELEVAVGVDPGHRRARVPPARGRISRPSHRRRER